MKKYFLIFLIIAPSITYSFVHLKIGQKPNRELAQYHLSRGSTLYVFDDYKGALVEYNLAVKNDSTWGDAYRCRGTAKIKLGLKNDACKDFNKAKELGDTFAKYEIEKYCK